MERAQPSAKKPSALRDVFERKIRKLIHVMFLHIVFAMKPKELTHTPVDPVGMKIYYETMIKPVIAIMLSLPIDFSLSEELSVFYMETVFISTAVNLQTCRIKMICNRLRSRLNKLENDYVMEVGSVSAARGPIILQPPAESDRDSGQMSAPIRQNTGPEIRGQMSAPIRQDSVTEFYKILNKCHEYVKSLEFDMVIYRLMDGYSVKNILRDEKLDKLRREVYPEYVFIRKLYCYPIDCVDHTKSIRGYPDYNGCVEDMKPAELDKFIRPGYVCMTSPMNTPISESLVEIMVAEFNKKLARFTKHYHV